MNLVVKGAPGVGKSTVLQQVLQRTGRPYVGFITKKEAVDAQGNAFVYIHAPQGARHYTVQNRVGTCSAQQGLGHPAVFDTTGVELLQAPVMPGGIILMDELGFLENEAILFQETVQQLFDADVLVLAAIKEKKTPFLQALEQHPQTICHLVTLQNREQLPKILQHQLEGV